MISTHQKQNTAQGEIYNLYLYEGITLPPHFHKSFEVAYLTDGTAEFDVRGQTHSLTAGDFVMVLPFEEHAFRVPKGSHLGVTVFSADIAGSFSQAVAGMQGETAVFRCREPVRQFYESEAMAALPGPRVGISGGIPELLCRKAPLYAVCAEYLSAVPLCPRDRNSDILSRVLDYIEQHFREDISAESVARALGYSARSLSDAFRDTLRIPFRTLLNQYRFEYANRLLANGNSRMTEVALESGFQSIRTFNRVFRELSGVTPRQALLPAGSEPGALQPTPAEASGGVHHPGTPAG